MLNNPRGKNLNNKNIFLFSTVSIKKIITKKINNNKQTNKQTKNKNEREKKLITIVN